MKQTDSIPGAMNVTQFVVKPNQKVQVNMTPWCIPILEEDITLTTFVYGYVVGQKESEDSRL
jgi:hypothetical protein